MKKSFYLAACMAAATALVSCNKNLEAAMAPTGTPVSAEISLSLAGTAPTKATVDGTAAENTIGSVDVFVFFKGGESDGLLDSYAHFDSAPYTLTATTGDRTIYALVNSEHSEAVLGAVSTKTELLAKVTGLSTQKTSASKPGNFTMIGSVSRSEATANALKAGENSITVKVDRIVSRVRLLKISRDFESAALAGQDFRIEEIFLSNAVDKDKYSLDYIPVADDFVNKLGAADVSVDLWMRRNIGQNLANGQSADLGDAAFSMYAMPNPVDTDSEDKPFTVRNTKLVVKAVLNARDIYYVVPLGDLKSNTTYDIGELVITRPGSSDPEKKTEIASCTFTVEANPWTVVPLETETGKYVI